MLWSFKSCGKCGGNLIREDDEWRCIHCGRYYNPNVVRSLDLGTVQNREGTPREGVAAESIDTLGDVIEM